MDCLTNGGYLCSASDLSGDRLKFLFGDVDM